MLLLHFGPRKGRPLHPAVNVALDLLAWAMAVPGVIVAVAGGIFWYWTDPMPAANGAVDCGFFFNTFTHQCNPIVFQIGEMEIAGAVFLFLVL